MVSLNTDILTLLVVIPLVNVTVWFVVLKSTSPDKKKELFHSNNSVVVATELTEVVEMVDYGHILFAINLNRATKHCYNVTQFKLTNCKSLHNYHIQTWQKYKISKLFHRSYCTPPISIVYLSHQCII